jgi:hypothetical protein
MMQNWTKNHSILKNKIFYKKEGRQFRIFYIMHTAAPVFTVLKMIMYMKVILCFR